MKPVKALIPLLVFGVILLAPVAAEAATANFFGPVISPECQCPGQAPGWGCVLQTIQNVVNLAISLGVIFAVIIIAWSGWLFMTSSLNAENRTKARTILMHAVIGLLIALSSWIIVDFVMKTLYNGDSDFGPWNTILVGEAGESCLQIANPPDLSGPGQVGIGGEMGSTTGAIAIHCENCVSISPPLTCKSRNSCTLASSVADKFKSIEFSGSWWVSEAFPPTVNHRAACHRNGTCIDASFRGSTSYNANNVKAFADAVAAEGLCVVFETSSNSLRDQVREQGVVAHSSTEAAYRHITGNHFSVYSNASNCH
jgi:hypothetical protein